VGRRANAKAGIWGVLKGEGSTGVCPPLVQNLKSKEKKSTSSVTNVEA